MATIQSNTNNRQHKQALIIGHSAKRPENECDLVELAHSSEILIELRKSGTPVAVWLPLVAW